MIDMGTVRFEARIKKGSDICHDFMIDTNTLDVVPTYVLYQLELVFPIQQAWR